MTVSIQPLVGQSIANLIAFATGYNLDLRSLEFCQQMSAECWTGYVGDQLICCWGLIPPSLLSDQAYLWMHTTPEVKDHQFLLVRHSQRVIEGVLSRYTRITGHCVIGETNSIRWLRWLGAEFAEPDSGLLPFIIRGKNG